MKIMNFFNKVILVFTYGPELQKILEDARRKVKEKERKEDLTRLNLCYEHRQEKNHSHFSKSNCDYCKILKEVKELKTVKFSKK